MSNDPNVVWCPARVAALVAAQDAAIAERTDRLFAILLAGQWVVGILVALVWAPLAWAGTAHADGQAVVAIWLGGALALPAALLAWRRAGAPSTRVVVAVAQASISALLIHLSGGRIEAHFHIFGSLAFLSFYRDWRLLAVATAIVTLDHIARGVYLPFSVFGEHMVSGWRWAEHAGWMLFEDVVLAVAIRQSRHEMREIAERTATLELSHAEIERQVAQRTAEFQAARDRAIELASLKSAFLANMSHEIRTPLNAVIGMTSLLLDTTLSREQREYSAIARSAGESLLGVINDILDLTKLEAGKLLLEPVECHPRDLVEGVLDVVAESAHTKGLELVCFIDDDVPPGVVTDARRARQVLLNLVSNAVKFTDHGEVVIRVSAPPSAALGDQIRLSFTVSDTGIGIDAATAGRLFQPFQQADASTTRRFGGTGLGLSISRGLVAMMGGDIGVDSRAGGGSTFWFHLPVGIVPPRAAAPPALSRRLRVLCVDDNRTCLAMLQQQLARLGAQAEVAGGGDAALGVLEQAAAAGRPFDLAVLDQRMPDTDGETLARRLRQAPRLTGLPILLLAPVHAHKRLPQLRGLQGIAVTTKPTKLQALAEHITALTATGRVPLRAVAPPGPVVARALRHRILIVDDNAVNLRVAVKMVQKLGYQADVAANGLEALEAIEHVPYDLVLMDCHMPEMDGFEATRAIRAAEGPGQRRLPVIALTAGAMTEDRERCFDAGMDDHVSKPIELPRLRAAIERGLGAAAA
ncbi:MAG: response regulator [Vicinamibacterales bacterium]|nr:response regulator [Vicinamibacterales bacterium]